MALFKLIPTCKNYLWGGQRLRQRYGKQSMEERIAETWELSCHADGESIIEDTNGKRQLLGAYLQENPAAAGEKAAEFEAFPLLVKLIDAQQALSVQVHPNDTYAMAHEGQFGKTEMWYVVEAEPNSFLYYGFKKQITQNDFRKHIEENTLTEVLNAVPVKAGDVFFIEAGTIHAIGAGIVIAEIQQSSNVTYRVYDYGRTGPDGKQRELHIEKACEVTQLSPPVVHADFGGHLAYCKYFTVDKQNLQGEIAVAVNSQSFHGFLCVDGSATMQNGDESITLSKGQSVFVPAESGQVHLRGSATILDIYLS